MLTLGLAVACTFGAALSPIVMLLRRRKMVTDLDDRRHMPVALISLGFGTAAIILTYFAAFGR